MSDKLRPGVVVTPEFVDGEAPPAAKLNSISVQMKYAAEQLEEAVGDIHSQSWPYSASNLTTLSGQYAKHRTAGTELSGTAERTLDIANLARLIGPASHMNARSLHGKAITENVAIGLYEFSLRFIPDDATAVGTVFSDTAVYATYFSVPSLMKTAGDYHVSSLGKVYSVSPSNGGTVDYNTTPANYGGGMNAATHRFNVIPDPNQITSGGAGLSFSAPDSQGRRTATLPVATHTQSNWEGTSVTLGSDDLIEGLQLRLPYVLTSNFVSGEEIPPGYLYVKNETTNKVYEGATYYYDTNSTFLILEDDLTDDITAGHAFSVFTVGNDITSAIDDLRVKSYHNHDRRFGEPFVDIDSISGFIKEPGLTGSWVPSEITGNFAPQYLHRDGYLGGVDESLNDMNAMRGPLLMGGKVSPGDPLIDNTNSSHAILFGKPTTQIYGTSGGDLRIEQPNVGGNDVVIGAAGSGSNGGHLVLEGGMTSNLARTAGSGFHAGVGSFVTKACRPAFSIVTVLDMSAPGVIDLTDYGLALTNLVTNYTVMAKVGNVWYHSRNADATYNFDVTLTEDGGTNLNINYDLTGSKYLAVAGELMLTIWYY